MSYYSVLIKNSAKSDLKKINKSHLKEQFLNVVETLKIDPYEPSQSFEKLQPKHLGRYSRRINHQHRVVYTVDDEKREVYIFSTWSHYE
ncbi:MULTISPECIES: Txe/YoeB family addiction module toxin [Staphylococcus]|uniref:Endoribonuclease YoeB n=1 Tax=Staphylococcus schleiferi TaxID=1295 RepID=A0A7Z7QRK2_STASC|nr:MULTISPECIES: Txe/YoeB family addiction module toxin [Staphylococcus]QGS46651.1 Txe/YoeB family addiction module toxin [Mammaliicoccus fleurettii]EPD49903.1 txe/YoeB family addiction module toxin [Staphylococcus sp. HGB0015]MBF1993280.1 Txe/YoeB family addiction module toxin [Staphylococcus schleiferi]MBF2038759.1 Txe/YoeB family addiction module toxin [Staphylococcus schleiferi]MBF2100672.1 Txe/YoeB family addiction module toxin [Staphylococcus schleiferi]